MAKKTIVTVIDDLTGQPGEDVEGLDFTYRGISYHIDLAPNSQKRFDEALAPFLDVAQRVGRAAARPITRRPVTRSDREQNQAIRDWANQQGLQVSERGRIPASVLEAFEEAH